MCVRVCWCVCARLCGRVIGIGRDRAWTRFGRHLYNLFFLLFAQFANKTGKIIIHDFGEGQCRVFDHTHRVYFHIRSASLSKRNVPAPPPPLPPSVPPRPLHQAGGEKESSTTHKEEEDGTTRKKEGTQPSLGGTTSLFGVTLSLCGWCCFFPSTVWVAVLSSLFLSGGAAFLPFVFFFVI